MTARRLNRLRIALLSCAVLGFVMGAQAPQGAADVAVAWESAPSLSYADYALQAVRGPGGDIYALGGSTIGAGAPVTGARTTSVYSVQANAWSAGPTMLNDHQAAAAASAPDGRLYVVGGYIGACDCQSAKAEVLAPQASAWGALPDIPVAREYAVAAVSGGRLFVIGGRNNSSPALGRVDIYDPGTGMWTTGSPMPTARYAAAVATGPDGRIYVLGGFGTSGNTAALATVEAFDPAADQWETRSAMPGGRAEFGAAVGSDGRIYAVGGHSGSRAQADVWAYNTGTDAWQAVAPLPQPRNSHGVASDSSGTIYAVAGCTDQGCATNGVVKLRTSVAPAGLVTRTGTHLYVNGQPYRPIGINIYNANSNGWCWYQMDGSILDDSLTAIGSSPNAMRAWFFQPLATSDGSRDWTAFDRTLATAKAHGYKVIATLTDQWGDCGQSTVPGYGFKDTNWYQSAYRQTDPAGTVSYRDWVAQVVSRYKDDPTILAWQLVNEPEVRDSNAAGCDEASAEPTLASFANDVSDLIKSIDPNHLVSLGTIGGGQCGAQGDDFQQLMGDPNLDLCEFHDYDFTTFVPGDQWNGLQRRIDQCDALDKPLIVGELGIKPSDVGGTLAQRAQIVAGKLCAQLRAGVAGDLLWAWNKDGSTLDNYDIGPNDPVLGVLGDWAAPSYSCAPPSVPTGVAAAAGDQMAVISWAAPTSDGNSPVTRYTITASPGGHQLTVDPDVRQAELRNLTDGTNYTFTIAASNAAGDGAAATVTATPTSGAPTPVAVTEPVSTTTTTTVSTGTDPAQTSGVTSAVTVPPGSDTTQTTAVSITQTAPTDPAPNGYSFGEVQINITAPTASSASNPLRLVFTFLPADGQTIDNTLIYRTEGTGTPQPVSPCASTSTASPDPCIIYPLSTVSINSVTYFQATVLTTHASRWNEASPKPVSIKVSDRGYTPSAASVPLGGRVDWTFASTKPHSVVETTGLGPSASPLFSTSAKTTGIYSYAFTAAGKYSYRSTAKGDPTTFAGTVTVNDTATPTTGTQTTAYRITWATTTMNGYVFDVQYRFRPAGTPTWKPWTTWKSTTTNNTATFTPTFGKGTYAFHSRITNTATKRSSDYSADTLITIG